MYNVTLGLVKYSHNTLNNVVELLDGSLASASTHQRRKEKPRGGGDHKPHSNGPSNGPMQSTFMAQPLHRTKLRDHANPVEQKEARDLPRGRDTCDVVEYKLVHQPRNQEGHHDADHRGPLGAQYSIRQ